MPRLRLVLPLVLVSTGALAHIVMYAPAPRYADQKLGPCGRGATDARTATVTTYTAGQAISVRWTETINHPGHYRIALDPNGQALFQNPTGFTDLDGGPGVLVDGIPDKADNLDGGYAWTVTLPATPCTNCTLQLIQVMTDKPPYGDGNDIYYQCADLVLLAPDGGTGGGAGGGAGGSGGSGGGAATGGGGGGLGTTDGGAGGGGGTVDGAGCSCTVAPPGLLVAALLCAAALRRRTRRQCPAATLPLRGLDLGRSAPNSFGRQGPALREARRRSRRW